MGQVDDGHRRGDFADSARLPDGVGDEGFLGPGVGLGFLCVGRPRRLGAQRVVVHEDGTPAAVQVAAHMGQLVQQAEPEIVEPVVAQGQPDDGSAVSEPERRAVEIRPRQVGHDRQGDAVRGQELLGLAGALGRGAEPRRLAQELGVTLPGW